MRQLRQLFEVGTIGDLTDGQLLDRFATRESEAAEMAFLALVERHGPMVLRTCRSLLRDEHATDDAFQATFLVLVEKAHGLWVRDSLGPWLYQVACRVSTSARADAARRRRLESQSQRLAAHSAVAVEPDDLGEVLHQELNRLPEKFRAAVVLCCLERLTVDQAARQLGWPLGTDQSRLARGRERLRERLTKRGVAPSTAVFAAALAAEAAQAEVPIALAEATARAAIYLATKATAFGLVPAAVLTLTEGAVRTMSLAKLKIAALTLLIGFGIGSGVVVHRIAARASAQETPPPPKSEEARRAGNVSKTLVDRKTDPRATAASEPTARDHSGDAEDRAGLARSYLLVGQNSQKRGRTAEAETSFHQARAILEALIREQPDVITHQADLARVLDRLGDVMRETGRTEESMTAERQAIAIQERLVADHATMLQFRGDLARSYTGLGKLSHALGRSAEAEQTLNHALKVQGELLKAQPENVGWRSDLADTHEAHAAVLQASGRAAEAEQEIRTALTIRKDLIRRRRPSGK